MRRSTILLVLSFLALLAGCDTKSSENSDIGTFQKPTPKLSPKPKKPPNKSRKKTKLGAVLAELRNANVKEGENFEILFTVKNTTKHILPGLIPPTLRNGSLQLVVFKAGEEDKKKVYGRVNARTYNGPRFSLKPNEEKSFRILAFNPWEPGLKWLETGNYKLKLSYKSSPHPRKKFIGQKSIDWKKVLVSDSLSLNIEKSSFLEIAATKAFFQNEHSSLKSLLLERNKLLTAALPPSLKRRISVFSSHALLARGEETQLATALKILEELVQDSQPKAESELYRTRLGQLYVQHEEYDKAKRVLEGVSTPLADYLRTVIKSQG